MRALFLLASVLLMFSTAMAELRTETLIRRAYLDMLGVPPTPSEMEWYLVYNSSNSYEVAVDHISKRTSKLDPILCKTVLLSKDYREMLPRPLTYVELKNLLLYNVGQPLHINDDESIKQCRTKFIEYCQLEAFGPLDVIDNMCEMLMSRKANIEESNQLNRVFVDVSERVDETTAWQHVLDTCMQLSGTSTK